MAGSSLKCVDFLQSDGKPAYGLIAVDGDVSSLTVDEQSAIRDAAEFRLVTHVFFRRFADGRSSHVSAYIVDNSAKSLSEADLANLHKAVWLQGVSPLLYVAWPARVDVITCARGPDFWNEAASNCQYTPLIKISAAINEELNKETNRFSANRLADGTFWDDPHNQGFANREKTAHQSLIQAVVECDAELEGAQNPTLRRLLILNVLIKYLDDRGVFPKGWFAKYAADAKTFLDVLRTAQPSSVVDLLRALETKFNGDIFALPEDGVPLTKALLGKFAKLVEARTLQQQLYLWEQFSFRHIPVEVISALYERFVVEGIGAVYTPPFLVSLLLDYAMPYKQLSGNESVLDPSCGSGVFLVGAFKRLVNIWCVNNGQRPTVAVLQKLLREQIFGVDRDGGAIHLTAFSLSLAICDALRPDIIWSQLKFEKLVGRNLAEMDFFDLHDNPSRLPRASFDLILGNPPFENKLTTAAGRRNSALDKTRPTLHDNQVAYLFLEQASTSLVEGGALCLIQPSQLLYNSGAREFFNYLLSSYAFTTVLDFTSVRKLFDGADPKAVAVLLRKSKPTPRNMIQHLTFRRTFGVHHRLGFELDYYDHNEVPQRDLERNPFLWKINLLGSGRLLQMSNRFLGMTTLAEMLEPKVSSDGWDYGEGFIAAENGPREEADFLTGKPCLPTEAFDDNGLDESKIGTAESTRFRSAYTESRYSPPLILIKENESLPIAFWNKHFLGFRAKIISIHAPKKDVAQLRAIYDILTSRHDFYRLCVAVHGVQSLVSRATAILKKDVDTLPFPESESDLDLTFWEEAIQNDVLDYFVNYVRKGQNSPLLRKAAQPSDLDAYCKLFKRMLSPAYDKIKFLPSKRADGLIVAGFHFGDAPKPKELTGTIEETVRGLIYDRKGSLRTVRVLRIYDGNMILIIKPDRLRYWIRSVAIRDADDTIVDLVKQGF
jgi:hypothetical protein